MPAQLVHLFQESEGEAERAGLVLDQADADIHLQEGKAMFHALLERVAHLGAVGLAAHVGIAVDADFVAELAAQHLVNGHAEGLAGQIPERHLDAAHPAALAGVPAKLLDAAEELVDVAGIFTQEQAFQHQGIGLGGGITHLAITYQALVGIQLHQGAVHRRAGDIGEAHIGYLEV